MSRRLGLLDFSALFYSNFFSMIKEKQANEIEIDYDEIEPLLRHTVFTSILTCTQKLNIPLSEIIFCCDGEGNWRNIYNPCYKQGRRESKEESEIDFTRVHQISDAFINDIKKLGFNVLRMKYAEADDIIASLVEYFKVKNKKDHEIIIISNDKDFIQLLQYSKVYLYSGRKDEVKYHCGGMIIFNLDDKATVYEPLTLSPKRFLLKQILFGDSIDGVPNIKNPIDFYVNGEGRAKGFGDVEFNKHFTDDFSDDEVEENLKEYAEYKVRIAQNTMMVDLSHTPEVFKRVSIRLFEANDEQLKENPIKAVNMNKFFMEKGLNKLSNLLSAGVIRLNR